MDTVQTNMVIAEFDRPALLWQDELLDRGILALPTSANRMRFVLHADIDDEKLERAIETIRQIADCGASASG
jgi:threonine aldolase